MSENWMPAVGTDLADVCHTCTQTRQWHRDNAEHLHHAFNDGSEGVSATFGRRRSDGSGNNPPEPQDGAEAVVTMAWPHDPVLRQALVDKGLLTVRDLELAERKIRALTGQMIGGINGQQQGG